MAYNTQNLNLINQGSIDGQSGGAPRLWAYGSADSDSTVLANGYFTDGFSKGMTVGDLVIVLVTGTPEIYLHVVTVASAAAGVTLGSSPSTAS